MIISIEHVTYCSANFEEDVNYLQRCGYNLIFKKNFLKNLSIKNKLMENFSERHHLALLGSKDSLNIEIVGYEKVNLNKCCMIPLFEESHSNANIRTIKDKQFAGTGLVEKYFHPLNATIYVTKNDQKYQEKSFKFNKIVCETTDIDNSLNFWKHLGFRIVEDENFFKCLEFCSLLRKGCFRILLEKKDSKKNNSVCTLDNQGIVCMAFVTNSVEQEREILNKKGFWTTTIERIELNNRKIDVFFVKGLENEIVEIYSIKK